MNGLNAVDRRTVLKLTGAGIAGGTTLVGSVTAGEETIDWDLLGCQAVIPVVPAPTSAINDMLPEGFTAQAAEDFSGAFDGITDALMGLEAFVCDEGGGKDVPYMSHYTPVIPPDDLKADVTWHFFKWEVLIDEPDLRRKLNAQGDRDPARPGDVEFIDDSNLKGTFGNDTEGFVDVERSPKAPPPDFTFREFTPTGTKGEYIQWDVTVSGADHVLGSANLKLPPKSRPANVLGTTSVDNAPVITGTLAFDPATITLP